jgi:DNA-directed RNA polymerase subunit RPC12/RpoP
MRVRYPGCSRLAAKNVDPNANFFAEVTMETIWFAFAPFLVLFAILFLNARRRVECPDCGATMPFFSSPFQKTRRMWAEGGYRCQECGCETDTNGRKVDEETPSTKSHALEWALLVIALLVGAGLGWAAMLVG